MCLFVWFCGRFFCCCLFVLQSTLQEKRKNTGQGILSLSTFPRNAELSLKKLTKFCFRDVAFHKVHMDVPLPFNIYQYDLNKNNLFQNIASS